LVLKPNNSVPAADSFMI